jgi:hypothetical protein
MKKEIIAKLTKSFEESVHEIKARNFGWLEIFMSFLSTMNGEISQM